MLADSIFRRLANEMFQTCYQIQLSESASSYNLPECQQSSFSEMIAIINVRNANNCIFQNAIDYISKENKSNFGNASNYKFAKY